MIPTTLRTVAADFAARIRQLTPSYPLFQDQTWSPVDRVEDVPGGRMRLFHCEWDPAIPEEDGIYGDAIEHTTTLRVFTNYSTLPEQDGQTQDVAAEIMTEDGRQLWIDLQDRVDPVVDGLLFVNPAGWTSEEDDAGHEWGYHEFEVRLLLSHTA